MRLIGLAVVLALGLSLAPFAADAQQAGKVPRIGFLGASSPSDRPSLLDAFRQRLRELGWVEGQNVVIDYRYAEDRIDRTAGLEWVAKQLELLKEAVPKIRRVAILSNPTNAYHQLAIRELKVAARSLEVQLQLLEARGPNEFDGAFAAMAKERVGALLVLSDVMLSSHPTRLADLAARSRLPAAYGVRESVEAGGLMSYGPSFLDLHRQAATYVDKILKGARPAELPVEQPTQFELVINLKTAKALGLTIPQSVLLRADQVIQ